MKTGSKSEMFFGIVAGIFALALMMAEIMNYDRYSIRYHNGDSTRKRSSAGQKPSTDNDMK